MNSMDMLNYRTGVKMQRRVSIQTQGEETLVVDFGELSGHRFVSKYYMLIEVGELTSVSVNSVMRAWLEYDDEAHNHPNLVMLDDE